MRILQGQDERDGIRWMERAGDIAKGALCLRGKRGSVIVAADGTEIGIGYNAPPLDKEEHRTCQAPVVIARKQKSDRTCCLHAEWRALLDGLRRHPDKMPGATLYYMHIDDAGNLTRAGEPYCTVCSRLALDLGLKEFVLWHESGLTAYPTDEYHRYSVRNLNADAGTTVRL